MVIHWLISVYIYIYVYIYNYIYTCIGVASFFNVIIQEAKRWYIIFRIRACSRGRLQDRNIALLGDFHKIRQLQDAAAARIRGTTSGEHGSLFFSGLHCQRESNTPGGNNTWHRFKKASLTKLWMYNTIQTSTHRAKWNIKSWNWSKHNHDKLDRGFKAACPGFSPRITSA